MNERDRIVSGSLLLNIFVTVCRWGVGMLFIAASIPKIIQPEEFMRMVSNYDILPQFLLPAAAITLPWIELACGGCLLAKKYTGSAALFLSFLICIFITGTVINYLRGANFECGCFGFLYRENLGIGAIMRDLVLLGLTLSVAFWYIKTSFVMNGKS